MEESEPTIHHSIGVTCSGVLGCQSQGLRVSQQAADMWKTPHGPSEQGVQALNFYGTLTSFFLYKIYLFFMCAGTRGHQIS